MNQSAAVMLFEENGIRPCKVEYDPDNSYNNKGAQHTHFFKCADPSVAKGDLVIVQTSTRHGFTVAKVVAIGFADVPVNFEDATTWLWIAEKFDEDSFQLIIDTEKKLVGAVAEANANMMRAKLQEAMGLNRVGLADVFKSKFAAVEGPAQAPTPPPSAYRNTKPSTPEEDVF